MDARNVKNLKMFLNMLASSVIRRRSRILVAVLAVAVGATVLLSMVTLYYDIPRQMSQEFRSYGANMVLVSSEDNGIIGPEDIDRAARLLSDAGLIGITPYRYMYVWFNSHHMTLAGTDFEQAVQTNPFWRVTGELPSGNRQVLVGGDTADFMKLRIGDEVEIEGVPGTFTISGTVRTGSVEDEFIFVDIRALSAFFAVSGAEVVEVSLAQSAAELEDTAALISQQFPGLTPRLVKRVTQSETAVLSKLQGLVYLVTFVVLILTMICVATTMMAVVLERRKEIGLKKAIGAESHSIVLEFIGESVILGLAGGFAGTVSGFIVAHYTSMSVFGRSISVHPWLVGVTIAASVVVTVLASLWPVSRAAEVEPAIVLRGE